MHDTEGGTFFDQLAPGHIATRLLDALPDTIAYVKDSGGVYQHVNKAFASTLQKSVSEIVGKTDSEMFPRQLAQAYDYDDAVVFREGKPIVEKFELVTHRPGIVRWYITNKIPLFDYSGLIVGLAGLSRPSTVGAPSAASGPVTSLDRALQHIHDNLSELINLESLASISGISPSSLERSFRRMLSCSPGRYIIQMRISRACELLANPTVRVSEVGVEVGYPDPVVFSRVFKREMRMSPSDYRKSIQRSV